MAGTTAAVAAVVSKLDALLQEAEDQDHRNGLPRGARRTATSIRTELLAALSLVSSLSAAEDMADLDWQLAHGGIRQQVDGAVRVLGELLGQMDMEPPPDQTTAPAPQHRARSRALRELCHGHGYDRSLDTSPGYCAMTLLELCYDTEDFLDGFSLALPVKKRPPVPAALTARGRGSPFLFPSARNSRAMEKAARRVNKKLSDVERAAREAAVRLSAVQVAAAVARFIPTEEEQNSRRRPPLPAPAAALVGVDGQRDELARMLLLGKEGGDREAAAERQVVVIVGDDGTGKTTLANEVYRAVGGHFFSRASVSATATENSTWESVLAEILDQVKDPPDGGDDDDDYEKLINKTLAHKRYLIVLDDISLVAGWRLCFPRNNIGSRILITATRDDHIVRSQWPRLVTRFYYMSGLTWDYAWLLFHRRVFGSEDRCPPELAEVADEVLRQCHSSPLAIAVLSGLLANKPRTRPVWEGVCSCIGRSNSSSSNRTEEICLLGYYALPVYLKTCLVYLGSVFPEDHHIDRDRAVRSWIAEGFVPEDHGVTLEEAGQSYFDDIVGRNMVQPACSGYEFRPVVYTIHGLIRSRLARENLATLLDMDSGKNESKSVLAAHLPRLLSV